MRHSFIPQSEQKALKREYFIHVLVVAFFLLSLMAVVGIISLFPAYVQAVLAERSQIASEASYKKDSLNDTVASIDKELGINTIEINLLLGQKESVRPSAIIRNIIDSRGSVRILSISIQNISTSTTVMNIQGIAQNREALVAFKTRLEGVSVGTKVELPLSGLAKSKDIDFSLKVTQTLQ